MPRSLGRFVSPAFSAALAFAAAAHGADAQGFDVRMLAPGVWAAEVQDRPPFYAFANSLVVELENGVLVVDSQQSPAAARAVLALIAERTSKPVRWVVATHHHADHVFGNQAYREAFPDVELIGHVATAEAARTEGAAFVRDELAALPDRIAERAGWLESGRAPSGEALTEAQRASLEYSVSVNRGYLQELRSLVVTPPDRTFTDSLAVGSGPRRAVLYHVGPAHTPGDVVVWLPGERVVALGDLLEDGLPWLEGSYPIGWARALERVRALDPVAVLPAHGSSAVGAELLEVQGDFFAALAEGVRDLAARGFPRDRIADRLDLGRFQERLAGTDEGAAERFRAAVEVGVERAWLELREAGA